MTGMTIDRVEALLQTHGRDSYVTARDLLVAEGIQCDTRTLQGVSSRLSTLTRQHIAVRVPVRVHGGSAYAYMIAEASA
ncbi:MAG: hypothetical protein RBR71_13275 [Gudongella sp.]|jgi:hypothetical protein|nr:hypothetical protein [Gudongella sp.]